MKVLVTGCAGFVGAHLTMKLLDKGATVVGVDNMNEYYDVSLKEGRLNLFEAHSAFTFYRIDLADREALSRVFLENDITHVVNLGAQAGVRYSLEHPDAYLQSNIIGFYSILELSRQHHIQHLIFSSSSSVYGANTKQPFNPSDQTDHQISFYAATKKTNEILAHSYAVSHGLPCTGLRFFTVYGPWGRPDMALFKFTHNILAGEEIDVYNNGEMARDFTYIDDVVESVYRVLDKPAMADSAWDSDHPNSATSFAPYRSYNVGRGQPVKLMDFIAALENELGIEAKKNFLLLQPGDVVSTSADISSLVDVTGFTPAVSVEEGVSQFVSWYRSYYGK